MKIEQPATVHGARTKETLHTGFLWSMGYLTAIPISGPFFFIALAGILWDCFV